MILEYTVKELIDNKINKSINQQQISNIFKI